MQPTKIGCKITAFYWELLGNLSQFLSQSCPNYFFCILFCAFCRLF